MQVVLGALVGACVMGAGITLGISFGRGSLQVGAITLIPAVGGAFMGGMITWATLQGGGWRRNETDS